MDPADELDEIGWPEFSTIRPKPRRDLSEAERRMADAFIAMILDENNTLNHLKKPAKRHCYKCDAEYVAIYMMLTDKGLCRACGGNGRT